MSGAQTAWSPVGRMHFASDAVAPQDLATAHALALVCAPAGSAFQPLAEPGRRLVLAQRHLLLEVRSPVLYARLRLGSHHPLPLGRVEPTITLVQGRVPRALLNDLKARAHKACPNEMAALVVYERPLGYRVVSPPSESGRGHVTYDDRAIDDATLVIDSHSHGRAEAYFSATDNASDSSRPGPYLSLVLGTCQSYQDMRARMRLSAAPFLVDVDADLAEGVFA
jgi:PRTRC genetic system protein A